MFVVVVAVVVFDYDFEHETSTALYKFSKISGVILTNHMNEFHDLFLAIQYALRDS